MSKEEDKFFTMRVPPSLHTEIKAHCAKQNITMKEFCMNALLNALNIDVSYRMSQVRPIYLAPLDEEEEE